jgi:hypothetical protein
LTGPRYSTGYISLFNIIGFVETHIQKKYADRVKATYEYMLATMITRHISKKKPTITERITICPWSTVHHQMGKLTPQKQLILGFEAGHKKKG